MTQKAPHCHTYSRAALCSSLKTKSHLKSARGKDTWPSPHPAPKNSLLRYFPKELKWLLTARFLSWYLKTLAVHWLVVRESSTSKNLTQNCWVWGCSLNVSMRILLMGKWTEWIGKIHDFITKYLYIPPNIKKAISIQNGCCALRFSFISLTRNVIRMKSISG